MSTIENLPKFQLPKVFKIRDWRLKLTEEDRSVIAFALGVASVDAKQEKNHKLLDSYLGVMKKLSKPPE